MPDAPADTNKVLDELMGSLARVFRRAGISDDQSLDSLHRALANCDSSVTDKGFGFEPDLGAVRLLTDLITTWRREPRFTGSTGEPLPLAPQGSGPCIEDVYKLAATRHPKEAESLSFSQALQRLIEHRTIAPTDENQYQLIEAYFATYSDLTIAGLSNLDYINDIASSCASNLDTSGNRLFQRRAINNRYPVARLPMLSNMLEDQGMRLLRHFDDYLEHESQAEAGDDACSVRVHLCLSLRDAKRPLD